MALIFRKACVADIKSIHAALMQAASAGQLLPRSLSQLYNHVRDFYVAVDQSGTCVGCCALSVIWDDLAEIRSLFLAPAWRGQGLGRKLVDMCLSEASSLGLRRVFTLTYQTGFFAHIGFNEVGKDTLPQKIWADCIHCPKFPECDEIAMLLVLPTS